MSAGTNGRLHPVESNVSNHFRNLIVAHVLDRFCKCAELVRKCGYFICGVRVRG